MDGERSDGGGEPEVEDEFACAGMLRGSLTSLHATVERIFTVAFGIGADDLSPGNNGQIWLKLRGQNSDVKAAKLFVKGLVNQEEQQEVSYPGVLHCIFCGARGLFMDCLIRNTSAHIVVGSTGFLLISGLAEPVVRAYSLITDLVERYEGTQSRRSEAGGPGESLDSRRAFKTLVEKWEDKHILDLLVLPGSVKEILLDLVKESGLGSNPGPVLTDGSPHEGSEVRWDKPSAITLPDSSRTRWVEGTTASSGNDSAEDSLFQLLSTSAGTRGRAEGAEERLLHYPQEVGEEEQAAALGGEAKEGRGNEEEQEVQLSVGNKEFWLLLKFFTAMGYTEDVVKRVLARTGPKEASQILDVVQQEQDRSDREQAQKNQENRPCETEHREDEDMEVGGDETMRSNGELGDGATAGNGSAEEKEEDFVLGVVKKAAASCGYTEQKVAKVYNMLPDRSTHQLLLELQREDGCRDGPREMDDVVMEKEGPKVEPSEDNARKPDDKGRAENRTVSDFIKTHKLTNSPAPHQVPEVKGPPTPTYPTSRDPPLTVFPSNTPYGQNVYWPDTSTSKHPTHDNAVTPKLQPQVSLKPAQLPVFTRNDPSPTRARERRGFMPASSVVVTGEQRFLEGLQMPFDLQLTDKPGNAKVRTIVIDGSNVAMRLELTEGKRSSNQEGSASCLVDAHQASNAAKRRVPVDAYMSAWELGTPVQYRHGLGHFFSCRGIALAVQHFWDRGHRHISALLPQWRQKSDHKTKEQHYLTELQKLGLLSYTPSREVQGKRISSYDDRFMLQLAQKTDGVIVTNDNLRDLTDESPVWRDIIKKRLLQYTFVGDHFMVPDDPLGRGGPHLDDFLRSEHRTPDPGNHSFAGVATSFPSSKPPRSQTEVLNFRDRTPGGAAGGGGWGKGGGQGLQQGQLGAAGPVFRADRTPEETGRLREELCQVFPGQDNMVALVLQCHPVETDMNVLSDLMLEL